MKQLLLQPGDIFLTKGTGFLSRAIRLFSRSGGESRTEANHVGIVVLGGDSTNAIVVEALSSVKRRRISAYRLNKKHEMAVFRPLNVSPQDMTSIVIRAESYVGRKYGYLKIVAHFIDYWLGGRYVARRLTSSDNYPICSWVVAYAYGDGGLSFGVEPGAASPDDIWDFVTSHPDVYQEVHPMGMLH